MRNCRAERRTYTVVHKFKHVPDPNILFKGLEQKDKLTTEAVGKKRSYCWKKPKSSMISPTNRIHKYTLIS